MARNKQPEELAKLKGADKKNPQRYRTATPKNKKPLGAPPAHLKPDVKKAWKELAAEALPGVLTKSEAFIMEVAASLLAQFRKDPKAFPANRIGHLVSCLARMGLTPSDRQKLGIAPDKDDENEFDKF